MECDSDSFEDYVGARYNVYECLLMSMHDDEELLTINVPTSIIGARKTHVCLIIWFGLMLYDLEYMYDELVSVSFYFIFPWLVIKPPLD